MQILLPFFLCITSVVISTNAQVLSLPASDSTYLYVEQGDNGEWAWMYQIDSLGDSIVISHALLFCDSSGNYLDTYYYDEIKKQGASRSWDSVGNLIAEVKYCNDRFSGTFFEYYSTGKVKSSKQYWGYVEVTLSVTHWWGLREKEVAMNNLPIRVISEDSKDMYRCGTSINYDEEGNTKEHQSSKVCICEL